MDKIYRISSNGRKYAGSISPVRRDEILDYLYDIKPKTATAGEISSSTGQDKYQVSSILRKMVREGYVEEISPKGGK